MGEKLVVKKEGMVSNGNYLAIDKGVDSSRFETEEELLQWIESHEQGGIGRYIVQKNNPRFKTIWWGKIREHPDRGYFEFKAEKVNDLHLVDIERQTHPDTEKVVKTRRKDRGKGRGTIK